MPVKGPLLPWKQMVQMRNVVTHEYDEVNLTVVWETVENDLPGLVTQLQHILQVEWPGD